MRSFGVARASLVLGLVLPGPRVLAAPPDAASGRPPSSSVSVTLAAGVGYEGGGYEGSPYLDRNLSGGRPALSLAVQRSTARGRIVAVELGSALPLEALQHGRMVPFEAGDDCEELGSTCTALGRHRDVLLSALLGARIRRSPLELKVGPSVVFGSTRQGRYSYRHADGQFAISGGVDWAFGAGSRIALVPHVRYSRAFRGDEADFAGIGSHILTVAVGVRTRLSPAPHKP